MKMTSSCRAAGERLEKMMKLQLPTPYTLRCPTSQVELASLATSLNKCQTPWELFRCFEKNRLLKVFFV